MKWNIPIISIDPLPLRPWRFVVSDLKDRSKSLVEAVPTHENPGQIFLLGVRRRHDGWFWSLPRSLWELGLGNLVHIHAVPARTDVPWIRVT